MPVSAVSWLRMIMIAAALMNPEITGWLNRFTMPPICVSRSNHSVIGGLQADHRGDAEVRIRKRRRMRAHRFGHHDRDHRNGSYREARRRTEHRVEQRRHDARVETRLRRQAGEERIGDRLRNGDDADDQSGEQVVAQIAALVAAEHVDDREVVAPVRRPNRERRTRTSSVTVDSVAFGDGCILATPR